MLMGWHFSFISQHIDAEQLLYSTKVEKKTKKNKSILWKGHSKASECKYAFSLGLGCGDPLFSWQPVNWP